jgi:hypothetical protein
MSPTTLYYVTLNSPTGAGTGYIAILAQTGVETDEPFSGGGGIQQINITSPAGATFQSGIKSNNGGANVTGTVTAFCISDVSFAECEETPPPPPPPPVTGLQYFGFAFASSTCTSTNASTTWNCIASSTIPFDSNLPHYGDWIMYASVIVFLLSFAPAAAFWSMVQRKT